jgi:pyridoxamine 5'-phosphate oxidase
MTSEYRRSPPERDAALYPPSWAPLGRAGRYAALRVHTDYTQGALSEADVAAGPIAHVQKWIDEATKAGSREPCAMTLATVGPDGSPTARIVLLRGLDERGFRFFTNYESKKGMDLLREPRAALCLFWAETERQVRVTGKVSRIARLETDTYFAGRPRGSQIGAWASPQSRAATREEIEARFREVEARYADGGAVPTPPHWGGYRLEPAAIELWQGRESRLHDRLLFAREDGGPWKLTRLAP